MKFLFFLLALLGGDILQGEERQERPLPHFKGHFYDEVGLFSATFKAKTEYSLQKYQKLHGKKIGILFLESLQGESIQSFTLRFIKKWDEEMSGGQIPIALLVVSMSDRKILLELNSRGLQNWPLKGSEKVIALTAPFLKEQAYEKAVLGALNQMAIFFGTSVRGPASFHKEKYNEYNWTIILIAFFLIFVLGRKKKLKESWFCYRNKNTDLLKSKTFTAKW